jgi:hypothetical protein
MGRYGSSCKSETALLFNTFWQKHKSPLTHSDVNVSTRSDNEYSFINLTDKVGFKISIETSDATIKLAVIDQAAMDEYMLKENIAYNYTQKGKTVKVCFADDDTYVGWRYDLTWKGENGSSDEDMDEEAFEIGSSLNTIIAGKYDLQREGKLYRRIGEAVIVHDGIVYEEIKESYTKPWWSERKRKDPSVNPDSCK